MKTRFRQTFGHLFPSLGICYVLWLAGCGQGVPQPDSNSAQGESPTNTIRLVSPSSVVMAKPNVMTEIRLTVMNSGDNDLKGVTPKLPCSCHVLAPLPAVFPARSSCSIAFKVLTPFAGGQTRKVRFFDGGKAPVGTVSFKIAVTGQVPRFVEPVATVRVSHIAGETTLASVVLETVERSKSVPFITDVTCKDDAVLSVSPPCVSETQSFDKQFVLRKYRVPVNVNENSQGDIATKIQLQLSDGSSQRAIPIMVHVLPRAHLLPNRLVFNATDSREDSVDEATLCLVPRVFGDVYEVGDFERDLLTIQKAIGTNSHQWTVKFTGHDRAVTSTTIKLVSSSGYSTEVPVAIQW